MPTTQVFAVKPSWEDEREREETRVNSGDWNSITDYASGNLPRDNYVPMQLTVNVLDIAAWDLYRCPGTHGLFSQRAMAAFRPYIAPHFSTLEAYVNNELFYILRIEGFLDCLDKDRSKLLYFKSDPSKVMQIERYHFIGEKIHDPTFFVVPEIQTHLFATQTIRSIIHTNKLKGIEMIDIESPPSWLNY